MFLFKIDVFNITEGISHQYFKSLCLREMTDRFSIKIIYCRFIRKLYTQYGVS